MAGLESKPKQQESPSIIDIDELARAKVKEVDELLNKGKNHKLEVINDWLEVLKQIITAADLHRTNENGKNDTNSPEHKLSKTNQIDQDKPKQNGDSIYADYEDDCEQFNAVDLTEQFANNSVKWTIRVKAFELVHQLIQNTLLAHNKAAPTLMKHLPDLIRLSFVAATSPYDDLKLQGFAMFKFIINKFSSVEEKEFPGHSILEQYKTQVLSAIKPAFDLDAPPYITAIASQVCCLWLCHGLEKDHSTLKRTYQLMLTTIDKLANQSINQNSKLYTESELEQERLDILSSWAQLYITSKDQSKSDNGLEAFVRENIDGLIAKWWEALKDYALLIMPKPNLNTFPTAHNGNNQHVYTRKVALGLFATAWPKITLALTIWLCNQNKSTPTNDEQYNINNNNLSPNGTDDKESINCDNVKEIATTNKYFRFICGILMKELYDRAGDLDQRGSSLPESTLYTIRSLYILLKDERFRQVLSDKFVIAQEFYTVLYKITIASRKVKQGNYNYLLKTILESIYSIGLTKISSKPNNVGQSIAKLIESINVNCRNFSNDLDEYNIILEFGYLMKIIESQAQVVFKDKEIKDALLETLRETLSFHKDPSFSITLLDTTTKDLYKYVPKSYQSEFVSALFDSKLLTAANLLTLIFTKDLVAVDKEVVQLEFCIKNICCDMKIVESSDIRPKMISSLIETLLNQFIKNERELKVPGNSQKSKQLNDLFNSIIENIEQLKAMHDDDFKSAIETSETTHDIYKSAMSLQENIKNELEDKRKDLAAKKLQATQNDKSKGSAKVTKKIVLKADFSNFYAKKP